MAKIYGEEIERPSLILAETDDCPVGQYLDDYGDCQSLEISVGDVFTQFPLLGNMYYRFLQGEDIYELGRQAADGDNNLVKVFNGACPYRTQASEANSAFGEWLTSGCNYYYQLQNAKNQPAPEACPEYYHDDGYGNCLFDHEGWDCQADGGVPGTYGATGSCIPLDNPAQNCGPDEVFDGTNCVKNTGPGPNPDKPGPGPQPKPGCPTGQVKNAAGKCVPNGTNPSTGCKPDEVKNAAGQCVPKTVDKPASTKTEKKSVWPWVAGGVLVAGAAGGAYYYSTREDEEKPKTPARKSNPTKAKGKHKEPCNAMGYHHNPIGMPRLLMRLFR